MRVFRLEPLPNSMRLACSADHRHDLVDVVAHDAELGVGEVILGELRVISHRTVASRARHRSTSAICASASADSPVDESPIVLNLLTAMSVLGEPDAEELPAGVRVEESCDK